MLARRNTGCAMALKWSISHDDRLVVFELTNERVLAEEIQGAMIALMSQGAMPYRKLIDARFSLHDPTAALIGWLGNATSAAARTVTLGPVAFVSGLDSAADILEHFNQKVDIDLPVSIFPDIEAAMRWLDEVAPVPPPPGE
jgi:hypothetical protein